MSDLIKRTETAQRAAEHVRGRYDAENDAGRVTWSDMALADALADALIVIHVLAQKVERLEAKYQDSKTP